MKIKRIERSILDVMSMFEAFISYKLYFQLQTVLRCPRNILNFDVRFISNS